MVQQVTGVTVDPKTLCGWYSTGLDGVVLNVTRDRRYSCTVEDVLKFVYELNGERFPENAKAFSSPYRFYPLELALYVVTGLMLDAATVWRWTTKGLNGSLLRVYRIGKKRVSTLSEVERFWRDAGRKPSPRLKAVVKQK